MPDPNERKQDPTGPAVLRLRSQEDLVAAVPHLLGFHPEDSLVIVCLAGDGPVLRIDEPATAEEVPEVAEALVAPFREQGFGHGGVTFIHFTSAVEGGHHRALNDLLVSRFNAGCGLDPIVTLHVAG